MTRRRVVVTGLGVVAPIGVGIEPFWESLIHGKSGVGPITAFDASPFKSRIAGEVRDFDPERYMSPKTAKRSARFAQIGITAALEAFRHAGLSPAQGDAGARSAIVMGSGIGAFDMFEREHESFIRRGPGKFHPLTVPMIIPNAAAGTLAGETGFRGPNFSVSTACATGATSIGAALDLVRHGRVDVAIAGSSESTVSPWALDGYLQLRALSTRNDDPEGASRPFSATRDGFVLAEGGGALILEALEHAEARGATMHAELLGYGATADGYHMTAPDPSNYGATRAMRDALADAGLAPEDVDLVNAHGTSTPLNDAAETAAIHKAFGDHAMKLMVQSTKSMTGHPIGGAASIESVASILQMTRGKVHPTINLNDPDPECDLDYVPNVARDASPRVVMKNAFGFGGHNAVLVFRRWDGDRLVSLTEALAEAGVLPDPWIRAWIRAQIRAGLVPAPIARAALPGQPPLELPPSFFAPWLGPRMKLSCGLWSTPTTTLAESEDAMLALTCERAGLAPGMRMLDLGAGFGALALWIAGRDPTSQVLAISNALAETAHVRARAPSNLTVELGDACTFEPAGSFDRVFAIELLEHVEDPDALLTRARGWLAPGGRLFVQRLARLQGGPIPERTWTVDGREYARTLEAWLARADGLKATGAGRRWRLLLLACAEFFARSGHVEHALFAPESAGETPPLPGGPGKPYD